MDRTVVDLHAAAVAAPAVEPGNGVLHPFGIVAIGVVFVSVRAAAFLAVLRTRHGHVRLCHEIVEFERFDQIAVPDQRAVEDLHVFHPLVDRRQFLDAFSQELAVAENGRVASHRLLHIRTQLGGRGAAIGITEMVETSQGEIGTVLRQFVVARTRLDQFLQTMASSTPKDNEIDQRVRAKSVGAVHRHASCFAHCKQTGDDLLGIAGIARHYFAVEVTGNAAHVVMDGRRNRQRFAGQIDTGEDLSAFGNARQALGQDGRIDMVEMEENVVLFRAHTAAFTHFERHRTADDVARRQILRARGVAFHEPLTFGVGQITALPACAFGDQYAGTVNTRGMELYEFHILQGQASAKHHAATVTGARVR